MDTKLSKEWLDKLGQAYGQEGSSGPTSNLQVNRDRRLERKGRMNGAGGLGGQGLNLGPALQPIPTQAVMQQQQAEMQQQLQQQYDDAVVQEAAKIRQDNPDCTDEGMIHRLAEAKVDTTFATQQRNAFQVQLAECMSRIQQIQVNVQQNTQATYQRGPPGGPGGSQRKEHKDNQEVFKSLAQEPKVPRLDRNGVHNMESWKKNLETKLTFSAVDRNEHRGLINAWCWGLLSTEMQETADDLRPEKHKHRSMEDYVSLIEAKFTPHNNKAYHYHKFDSCVQKKNTDGSLQLAIEFYADLKVCYQKAGITDEWLFCDRFLKGIRNQDLIESLCRDSPATGIANQWDKLMEHQGSILRLSNYGKSKNVSVAGLEPFSTEIAKYTHRMAGKNPSSAAAMDLSNMEEGMYQEYSEYPEEQGYYGYPGTLETQEEYPEETLFLQQLGDHEIREMEDEDTYHFWEGGSDSGLLQSLAGIGPGDKKCFVCHRVGHFKANCPERRQQRGGHQGVHQTPRGGFQPPRRFLGYRGVRPRGGGYRGNQTGGPRPSYNRGQDNRGRGTPGRGTYYRGIYPNRGGSYPNRGTGQETPAVISEVTEGQESQQGNQDFVQGGPKSN